MESKITLLLFVFLVFCLVGNDLYEQVKGIVTQNKGNPDGRIVEGKLFCRVNWFKTFIRLAKGIWTSRLTDSVPTDVGIPVLENQNFFSGNVSVFDTGVMSECHKRIIIIK